MAINNYSKKPGHALPHFLSSLCLSDVQLGYSRLLCNGRNFIILTILAIPLVALKSAFLEEAAARFTSSIVLLLIAIFTCAFVLVYLNLPPGGIYLLDFACFRPPPELKISEAEFIEMSRKSGGFDEESIDYMKVILRGSGIGDETCMPEAIFQVGYKNNLKDGREEAAMVMFSAVDDLLAATKVHPERIGIVIVNCGVLNTTPSLSSMVINRYKLREDVMNFNLGGMGCSAGLIAVDLAADLLAASEVSYALVVSLEAVTYTWYKGKDRRMLLSNCFFRMGSAAMLLTNRRADGWFRGKYKLERLVRIHSTGDDRGFESIRMVEDEEGRQGICVCPEVMDACARVMEENVGLLSWTDFEHVCMQAVSKETLEHAQGMLKLSPEKLEGSIATLRQFGNTSSSSIWYVLAYLEAKGKVKNGHRVLQIAYGSGLKCNTAVWKALRNIPIPKLSPWLEIGH